MNFITTLFTIFFFAVALAQEGSQKVEMDFGSDLKSSRKSTLDDIIGFDDKSIYTIKVQRKGLFKINYILERYDHNFILDHSNEIDLEMSGINRSLEFIFQLKGELFLFSSLMDKKEKINTLYVETISKETLKSNGDRQELAHIDYSGHGKWNSGFFGFDFSRDSSKLMVYYDLPYERGNAEQFGIHVFDNEFEQIWHKELMLPYTDNLFQMEDFQVDNDGNAYFIGLLFKGIKKLKRKGEPNYTYQVLNFYNEGNELKEFTINLEDKFITDMKLGITDNQNLVCGGFYSDRGTFSIKGSYFMKINGETKDVMTSNSNEFGIDFITSNMKERKQGKAKKNADKGKNLELYKYNLDDIIIRSDGGAVLIGEQFFIRQVTRTQTSSNGRTTTTTDYHYYYNDIIAVNMAPDGTIEWTEKIAKRQHTVNDGGFYSSYAKAVVDDKLYFIFNDSPLNVDYKGTGKVHDMKGKKSVVTMVELDREGHQSRENLFATKDAGVMTRPKVCEQISPYELILFGQRKKKQKFVRLTFK